MGETCRFPESGMTLADARAAIEALRGQEFVNRATGITAKESRQHGHHIYSVEAIKVEALDRKVEVVSGNTPHASSASTGDKIASSGKTVKWAREFVWIAGAILLAIGLGNIVVNAHETIESLKYRELFWGLIKVLLGFLLIYVGLLKKKGAKGAQ